MKVIFLDIDGVLVCYDSVDKTAEKPKLPIDPETHMHNFHKPCVKNLNKIIEATGAKLVLSSTWRFIEGLDKTNEHLTKNGVVAQCVNQTPDLNRKMTNGVWIPTPRGEAERRPGEKGRLRARGSRRR